MLSLIVKFYIQGCYWTYAMFPWRKMIGSYFSLISFKRAFYSFFASYSLKLPFYAESSSIFYCYSFIGIRSPIMVDKILLLPDPTSPTIQTNSPFLTVSSKSLRTIAESRLIFLSFSSAFFFIFFFSSLSSSSFFVWSPQVKFLFLISIALSPLYPLWIKFSTLISGLSKYFSSLLILTISSRVVVITHGRAIIGSRILSKNIRTV